MGTMLIVAAEQVSGAHVMRARQENTWYAEEEALDAFAIRESYVYGCLREYVLLCVTW